MRKSLLLFAMGLTAAMALQAQTVKTDSPWTGSALPEEGGTYYLYNVESGMWLQHNRRDIDSWTTRAQLDKVGFDVVIKPLENGFWQLDPRFGHNHSLNALTNQGYMDTGDAVSEWTITPYPNVAGYSASNLYVIEALDGGVVLGVEPGFEEDGSDTYLSYSLDGFWQFVSKEERMADMLKATKNNPKDATWLVGGYDFANQDDRNVGWKSTLTGGNGYAIGGDRWGINPANRAVESWNGAVGQFYQDITGLPNGTYGLTVQGYYRDGSTNAIWPKHEDGSEVIRAFYYANEVSAPFMSICEQAQTEFLESMFEDEYDGYFFIGDGGKALGNAANAFYAGYYWNPEIQVIVTNGTLRIGVEKTGGVGDDWTVFDNFRLTYYGDNVDVSVLIENLKKVIAEADAYDGLKPQFYLDAYNAAVAALDSTDPEVIGNAMQELNNKLAVVKAAGTDIENFNKTIELCRQEMEQNGENKYYDFASAISEAQQKFESASDATDYSAALRLLQIARNLYNAERGPRLWEGSEPVAGEKYYFYNLGQGRFLCGGDDWGAHAALGWPGIEIALEQSETDGNAFRLDTYLNNGGTSEYLNFGGYMDTGGDDWVFEPLGNGIYNIVRADSATCLLGWRPGTAVRVDTDLTGSDNPDNQWVLVSRAERDAIAETATAANPIDMSYRINVPNFSQRENMDESGWVVASSEDGTHGIWGRGSNYPDFTYECWNMTYFDFSQVVYDLPAGWYKATVTGYYRDGDHNSNEIDGEHVPGHIEKFVNGDELNREAYFYVFAKDEYETLLPSLTDYRDMAPGLGAATDAGEVPQWVYQAVNYFQNNLYKVELLVEVGSDGELTIGVNKDFENFRDWVVVDNFRLIYYKEDPSHVQDVIAGEPAQTSKLYNLQGIEVAQPVRGIYVRDGKKVIVK